MFSGETVPKPPSIPSTNTNGVEPPCNEITPRKRIVDSAFGSPEPFAMVNPATLPLISSAASPILPAVKSSAFTEATALVTSPLRCVP